MPNLVIIALTMILMRYGILQPILISNGLSLELSTALFFLMVLVVVLIAAAGYMINDYYDVDTDTLNKPDKMIVGKIFSADSVYYSYVILNFIALVIAFYVTKQIHFFSIFFIFPMACGVLWFYSTTYKKQFLIGNLIVSFLLAGVPLVPLMYEMPLIITKYRSYILMEGLSLKYLYIWVGAFSVFAFFINLIREIVKDAEDFYGDEVTGCNTVPIFLGEKAAKIIIVALTSLVILLISFIYIFILLFDKYGNVDYISMFYLALFVVLPLIYIIFNTLRFGNKKGFSRSSLIIKIVLVLGVLYAWVLRNKII